MCKGDYDERKISCLRALQYLGDVDRLLWMVTYFRGGEVES